MADTIHSTYEELMNSIKVASEIDGRLHDGKLLFASFLQHTQNKDCEIFKFGKLSAELMTYMKNYDFQSGVDISALENYLGVAKEMEGLIVFVDKQVNMIRPFANRNNKEGVVKGYMSLVKEIYEKMGLESINAYKARLNAMPKQVNEVLVAFENEKKELAQIYEMLNKKTPNMWKEDNEKLLGRVSSLVSVDLSRKEFDLASLKKAIVRAKNKRKDSITEMRKYYPWLDNEDYKTFHNNLLNRYIRYDDYKAAIEEENKKRTKKMLKVFGIIVLVGGGIALATMNPEVVFGLLAGALVIWIFFKFFAKSSNDYDD